MLQIEEDETLRRLSPRQKYRALEAKKRVRMVDETTGEDVTDLYNEPTYRTTSKQRKAYASISTIKEHEKLNGGYVFAFFTAMKPMAEQFPTLTQSDMARVMFLSTYVAWGSGELRYDNGRVIDKKGLEKLIGISQNKFIEFRRRIIDAGILHENDNCAYSVDRSLFYRGEARQIIRKLSDDETYTKLFRTTIRDLYTAYSGRSIKLLGIIYSVLPYINFNFNIITANPQEQDARLVRPLELQDLARALGYSNPQKLRQSMRRLQHRGQPVFAFVDMAGRGQRIIVNPRVLFAGSSKKALDAMYALFNDKG